MDLGEFMMILIPIAIVYGIGMTIYEHNIEGKIKNELSELEEKGYSLSFTGINKKSAISINIDTDIVCFIKIESGSIEKENFSFKDILSSEIVEDGHSVTKTSRTSQVGGALLGGLAFGGVGAIIGGLSGKTTTHNNITRIDVIITVNNPKSPVFTINVMDIDSARNIHATMAVLIEKADRVDFNKNDLVVTDDKRESTKNLSLSEELIEFSKLRDAGIITEEEFNRKKKELINI